MIGLGQVYPQVYAIPLPPIYLAPAASLYLLDGSGSVEDTPSLFTHHIAIVAN